MLSPQPEAPPPKGRPRAGPYTLPMSDEPPPILAIRNFNKAYGGFVAVKGLSFELRAGDILALVGPNGAGKTTTMRAVSGILAPTSGTIAIAGHDLAKDPIAAKGSLAYVPDDPKLFDTMSVMEHLEFIGAAYRVPDWKDRAEELLSAFELKDKRGALGMELSRGMRQKVAIACAYLHSPPLIMLDEPLTGLDPIGIRTMKDSIRDRGRTGAAVVLSSHLLSLVEDICTRVLIMMKGTPRFVGTIPEARERYGGGAPNASLEDVFFRATSDEPAPAQPGAAP